MKLINFIKAVPGKKQYEISRSEKTFLVLLGFVICGLIFIQLRYQRELQSIRKGKKSIQQKISKKKTHEMPLQKIKWDKDTTIQRISFVKNKKEQPSNPYNLLTKIFKLSKKHNTPIQSISGTVGENIKIDGQTSSIKNLKKFIDSLTTIKYVNKTNLESIKSTKKSKVMFNYSIKCS